MGMAANEEEKTKPVHGTGLCNRRVAGPDPCLPNSIRQAKEPALLPEAFRVLSCVASLPEDWQLRTEQAAKACQMGRERTRKALNDLEGHKLARHVAEPREDGSIS